jgi:hypothetical protein
MTQLLQTRLIKSRFIALLNLGLSAVVLGASSPPVYADVSPAALALHVFGEGDAQLDKAALSSASLNSIQGKLFAYKRARMALEESVAAQNNAYEKYLELSDMSGAEVSLQFPGGHYRATLAEAVRFYNDKQAQAEIKFHNAEMALMEVTDGEKLSDEDMSELHDILGL